MSPPKQDVESTKSGLLDTLDAVGALESGHYQ